MLRALSLVLAVAVGFLLELPERLARWIRSEAGQTNRFALAGALVLAIASWATVARAAYFTYYDFPTLSTHVASEGVIHQQYSRTTGIGYAERTFSVTLSSGTGSINRGAGTESWPCRGGYASATVRSFAVNFGHVATQRTTVVKLGGGGTTNDTIEGTCRVKETVTP